MKKISDLWRITVLVPVALFPSIGCSVDPCDDDAGAFVAAQNFIKDNLKAPSTASFPLMVQDGNTVTHMKEPSGACSFSVETYVDAQNSFGAKIRTKFDVTVEPNSSGGWRLINLIPY